MNNFFKKQREIIAIIVYIGVVLSLVFFVIFPLLSRIEDINDQIQKEKLNQEIKKNKLDEFPKMSQQYEMLQKNENLVDILFDQNEAVVLIERLEKLSEDSGNKITITIAEASAQKTQTSISKTATEKSLVSTLPAADYMRMKISLIGKYNTIVNFINLLESLEYYSDIVSTRINQNELTNNQSANAGMFGLSNSNPADDTKISNSDNNLTASIDVVFYTKK